MLVGKISAELPGALVGDLGHAEPALHGGYTATVLSAGHEAAVLLAECEPRVLSVDQLDAPGRVGNRVAEPVERDLHLSIGRPIRRPRTLIQLALVVRLGKWIGARRLRRRTEARQGNQACCSKPYAETSFHLDGGSHLTR